MKQAPTLIDHIYRASFRNERNAGWTSNAKWRDALRRSRKFVLDDDMSTFLGELGTQAFTRPVSAEVKRRTIEHLRMSARLPSEITWIEYNLRKCQSRSNELLGKPPVEVAEMPEREGWLLMRHPKLDTAFMAIIVSHDPKIDHGDGHNTWTFPVALAWTADMDTVLPWRLLPFSKESAAASEVSTGLLGYKTDRAGFVQSDMLDTPNEPQAIAELLKEWSGVQRRVWALLATINDLPVVTKEVRASKGFMGARSYRKFLDHRTVTLTVPQKEYKKVARKALATVYRRGGPVREHWRDDWRRPYSPLCEHEFSADEGHKFCTRCGGREIWVREHMRGDTSRGFVMRDYTVTHDPNDMTP